MPGRFIYRFPDRMRFWKFNALALRLLATCFLSMWVSPNNRKPILTGFRFSLRPMYALITSWVALTGWKRSGEAVGVAGSVVLSAALWFPMSRGFRWFGPFWRFAFPVYRAGASCYSLFAGLRLACRLPYSPCLNIIYHSTTIKTRRNGAQIYTCTSVVSLCIMYSCTSI